MCTNGFGSYIISAVCVQTENKKKMTHNDIELMGKSCAHCFLGLCQMQQDCCQKVGTVFSTTCVVASVYDWIMNRSVTEPIRNHEWSLHIEHVLFFLPLCILDCKEETVCPRNSEQTKLDGM